ncbi:Membrane protein related to metalloendopeptidase [Gilliamella apis SCGC AB-598-P17]|nr:Membrane protein related to metalloendopeptidase [Gilliamella apis SCGC AB-598-P17]
MKGVIVKKILTLSCLSLMISACTQTNPAEIEDISDSSSRSSSSVYSKPPTNISTGSRSSSQIYSSSTPASRSTVTSNSTRDSQSVVTSNERIVYNRNYNDIPKGGYQGDTYTVKRGDTLFYIAWVTGNDYRALAAKNNIKEPFAVNVGQVLDVSGGTTVVETKKTTSTAQVVAAGNYGSATNTTTKTKPVVTTVTTTTTTTSGKDKPTNTIQTTETVTEPVDTTTTEPAKLPTTSNVANIVWQWPAQGKIIEKFSNASKGIDISGTLGTKVVAAANGRVVYSGNALPGYGNLIIIKHNDDYLTAYAHNQTILVKEQQNVRAGEQIATMGATGTSSVRLHFEIRYKAQSVDPLKYLSTN